MGNRSGLIALCDSARAYFDANDVAAVIPPVGLKYRTFQINQGPGGGSRVVFIPGEFDGSGAPKPVKLGPLKMPRHNVTDDGNPRALVGRTPIFTLSIWAVDIANLSNEEAQWAALEDLAEVTVQAVRNGTDPVSGEQPGLANVVFRSEILNRTNVENAFGFELLMLAEYGSVYLDQPVLQAFPQPAVARGPAL